MTTIHCDICKKEIKQSELIKVTINDGEHPHNGSRMTTQADVCVSCAQRIPLECRNELSDLCSFI